MLQSFIDIDYTFNDIDNYARFDDIDKLFIDIDK